MSSIFDTITNELGGGTLAALGTAVGATPEQTRSVVGAAIPALIAGLASNVARPEGAAALAGALDKNHGPNLMDHLGPLAGSLFGGGGASSSSSGGFGALAGLAGSLLGGSSSSSSGGGGLAALLPMAISAMQSGNGSAPAALNGAGILGHIFGGAQNKVADTVAKASGVDASIVMKLLPILAPIVMSALGTLKQKRGLDAGGLSSLLKNEAAAVAPTTAADDGFGVDDLMKIGGLLSKLF